VGRWKDGVEQKGQNSPDALKMLRRLKFRNSTLHRDRHWQCLNCDGGLSFWAIQGEQIFGGKDQREGRLFFWASKTKPTAINLQPLCKALQTEDGAWCDGAITTP